MENLNVKDILKYMGTISQTTLRPMQIFILKITCDLHSNNSYKLQVLCETLAMCWIRDVSLHSKSNLKQPGNSMGFQISYNTLGCIKLIFRFWNTHVFLQFKLT